MIEIIRLIRKKKDDIWALYIIEFLKFIGCIVNDYVFPDTPKAGGTLEKEYDVNLVLNISEEEMEQAEQYAQLLELKRREQKNKLFFISYPDPPSAGNVLNNNEGSLLLSKIILKVWNGNSRIIADLLDLNVVYSSSNVFFFLYNEGNLKFVQEYTPLSGRERKQKDLRKEAYEKTFYRFGDCYNLLIKLKKEKNDLSCYYDYALLLIKYKLNEVVQLLEENIVFYIDSMLEQVDRILEKEPDFIRIYYLAGSICKSDMKYWWRAEWYYEKVIEKLIKKKKAEDSICFLYYQMGKFYEKRSKEWDRALEYYLKAYNCNHQAYRALYKLTKDAEQRDEYGKVIENANKMIEFLMNGYQIKEIMPKEQLYAYKCFRLMGDAYFENRRYDLALLCYRNSEKVARETSLFYTILNDSEYSCFEQIFRQCMPLQPVYFGIISCAAKENSRELSEKYFLMLQKDNASEEVANEGNYRDIQSE